MDPVLVLRDEAKADLDTDGEQKGDNAQATDRIMPDPRPLAAQRIADGARAAEKAGEPCGGAPDEAPQQAEDQQCENRAAGPDMPIGVVVVHRPPAKRDQGGEQPVNDAGRQVPDRLRFVAAQCFISMRYLSWHALQVPARSSAFAFNPFASPASAVA